MPRLTLVSLLSMAVLACGASSVSGTTPDAASEDVSQIADAVAEGVASPDVPEVLVPDVPPVPDADAALDADVAPAPRLIARLSSATVAAQEVGPNATGVFAAAFDVTVTGDAVPVRAFRFRRVGVGRATDIANAYFFAVPSGSRSGLPLRFSAGRAVNPVTNLFEYPLNSTVRAGVTVTILVFLDFNAPDAGGQHAIELVEAVTDRETIPFVFPRGFPITVVPRRAVRLGIRPGPDLGPTVRDVASAPIVSFSLVGAESVVALPSLAFTIASGSLGMRAEELSDLELWRGPERIPLIEWNVPFNGMLFLVPTRPLEVPPNATTDFAVRGRITVPVGSRIRAYAEYPADFRALDIVRGERAATCLSATHAVGCDGPGQANFDGRDETAMSIVTVTP